jgi:nucleoid DNA-binding protein
MSKELLVDEVAATLGGTKKDALAAVDAVAAALSKVAGAGAVVRVAPLGTFKRVHKPQRTGRNPQTGEAITIAARDVITFKPSKA